LLLKYIPYDLINKAAKTNRNASYIIGLIFLLFSVTIVVFTASAITKPLNRLSKKMDQFSKGNFNVEADVCGRDEIAHISKQFNLMAKNTDELITEKYKMKLIEKSSILKALEAEINPHFLYNALQAISTRALKSKEYSISNMVDALASTFRYSIKGGDVVTINEEIKHVGNYLVIQEARFGERLKVIYDIEENALEVKIPKLAIQTLVENSIKHVLETISKTLCIYISAKVFEDVVLISVRDDGPGISKQKLEAVLEYLKENWEGGENEHIGLRNLNTRLNLIFGSEANIQINTDKTGTEINFSVPKGGCINVKCSDC
jgi:two-component system sensor histidine kinase YesM